MAISRAASCRAFAKASLRPASSLIQLRMVDSGTPYFFATAQMELEPSIAITTSARNAAGYFFPRCFPATVFLQYARFFAMLSPPIGAFLHLAPLLGELSASKALTERFDFQIHAPLCK